LTISRAKKITRTLSMLKLKSLILHYKINKVQNPNCQHKCRLNKQLLEKDLTNPSKRVEVANNSKSNPYLNQIEMRLRLTRTSKI
jgi:Fe-S cluster assembly iron-binding protein IscA